VYSALIGKIVYPETTKPRSSENGVREMHQSISNPLYKNYDPRGYVKSEDEIGKELITELTGKFNSWLASLKGEEVKVEPDLLINILRTEMELPEPGELTNIEKFAY
jgi:hypothetical protein